MSDQVACPSCKALMLLPSGAKSVRCPHCNKILRIENTSVTSPPAKVVKTVPTLTPPQVLTTKKPKIELVDEAAETEAADRRAKAEKKMKLLEDLEQMEDEREEERERRIEMKEYCRVGRKSLGFFYWGVRVYGWGLLITLITVFVLAFVPAVGLFLLPLCGLLGFSSIVLIGIGFVAAGFGPPASRHFGWIGLGCTVLQLLLIVAQIIYETVRAIAILRVVAINPDGVLQRGYIDDIFVSNYALYGLNTNLFALSDSLARLITRCGVPWFGLVAGAIEFTRMVVLGMLVQHYADQGKAPETGYKSYRVVTVFFWTILLTMMFRLAFCLFAYNVQPPPGDLMFLLVNGMHGVLFIIGFFVLTLQTAKLSDIIEATKEVVVPDRYLAISAPMEL